MPPRSTRVSFVAIFAITVTLAVFGLVCLLLPQRTTAQSQPEALGSLRGVVRNEQGDPLSNITVSLRQYSFQYEYRHVTSNGAGVYEFLSLPSGTYTLRFEDNAKQYATKYYIAADFANDATTVVVNGNDVGNVDMELAQGGSISLTLESSSPVTMTYYFPKLYYRTLNGTWLIYYRQDNPEIGKYSYSFDGLPTGNYRLCASKGDYYYGDNGVAECYDGVVSDLSKQRVTDATDIQVKAGQATRITIDFNDNPQIEGTILSPSNTPLAGISVILFHTNFYQQYSAKTDENGYFRLPNIEPGTYNLVYNTPTYEEQNAYLPTFYPDEDTPATMDAIQVDHATQISSTIKLRAAAQITGTVTLPENAPLAWAMLSVFRQLPSGAWNIYQQCLPSNYCFPLSTYNANTGVYTVTNLIPGDYRVGADAYLNSAQFHQFTFYGGDSLEEADTIAVAYGKTVGGINIVMGEGKFDGVISGRVTANDQPVAGIEVGLFWPYNYNYNFSAMPQFSTVTDAEGRYALEGLSAGNYVVGARDPHGMYATTFYLEGTIIDYAPPIPGTTLWYSGTANLENIDIALSPGATVRGHIRAQGKMNSDYVVQLVPTFSAYPDPYSNAPIAYADERSAANGFFEMTGVNPGSYYLRVYPPSSNGEFIDYLPIFYPGVNDGYLAQPITVTAGQTLEGKDLYIFNAPTLFLPAITGEGETPPAGLTPSPWPPMGGPFPPATATPMFP